MLTECCDDMQEHINFECIDASHNYMNCANYVMHKYTNTDGAIWYGIPIQDGGSSAIEVFYCPWCGTRLIEETAEEENTVQLSLLA